MDLPYIHLSTHLSTSPSMHLSIYFPFVSKACPSPFLANLWPWHLNNPSMRPQTVFCLRFNVHVSMYPSLHLSIHPFIHLSMYPSIHLSIDLLLRRLIIMSWSGSDEMKVTIPRWIKWSRVERWHTEVDQVKPSWASRCRAEVDAECQRRSVNSVWPFGHSCYIP